MLAQGEPSEGRVISGTVTYRQRIALAPGSLVEVLVEDAASDRSPARVVGSTRIETSGQVPIPFRVSLPVETDGVLGVYAVSARITGPDGRQLFVSDTPRAIPMDASRDRIDLVLVPAGRPRKREREGRAPAPSSLETTGDHD